MTLPLMVCIGEIADHSRSPPLPGVRCRPKIGLYIALRLLRDGAGWTITTRFLHDAVRRFALLPGSGAWLHRVRVVGIDLCDLTQVNALADDVRARGPLDILVNNAAQTVRRTRGAYAPLVRAESAPLDLVDGAARVYDAIVRGEAGEGVYDVFLKDFVTSPW